MHHIDQDLFLGKVSGFLGGYFLFVAVMNAVAAFYLWRTGRSKELFRVGGLPVTTALFWLAIAMILTIASAFAFGGTPWGMPLVLMDFADWLMSPVVYTVGSLAVLSLMFVARDFFVRPFVAWSGLNIALFLMGLSMTDQDFYSIVGKPDNVPIVGMVFLLGYFTWLGAYKAVINDRRIANGEEPLEALDKEKVLVWPDLVYTELICMVALTALLIVWAIVLKAPLEEPASAVKTPNPSKAPWYFLGLQEMLVYYDPWYAGVVLPSSTSTRRAMATTRSRIESSPTSHSSLDSWCCG